MKLASATRRKGLGEKFSGAVGTAHFEGLCRVDGVFLVHSPASMPTPQRCGAPTRRCCPHIQAPHRTVDAPRRGLSPDAFILDNTVANGPREVTTAWPDEHCRLTMTAAARSKPAARSLHLQARHIRQMI